MQLGIDASNIRAGGGVTHLVELLRVADPAEFGFARVTVWGGRETLTRLEDRPWLMKIHVALLDRTLPYRIFWQCFMLSELARTAECDVLFVPGGSYSGEFQPVVTMSQNMLPFEWGELRRYGWSFTSLRLFLLRWTQARSFRRAAGLIFLSRYARSEVTRVIKGTTGRTTIVPHGVHDGFEIRPREPLPIDRYSASRPYRILYVSIVDWYKHQWHVAEAVGQLRRRCLPVVLDLVGPAHPSALSRLRRTLDRIDPAGEFVRYVGPVTSGELPERYAKADLFVFASSCENLPNILLEGMASGLPIACSNRGPMPEVLGDAGVYFDPENPDDIARALLELIDSPELRARLAQRSFERAQEYSWQRCAYQTFAFLAEVSRARTINSDPLRSR